MLALLMVKSSSSLQVLVFSKQINKPNVRRVIYNWAVSSHVKEDPRARYDTKMSKVDLVNSNMGSIRMKLFHGCAQNQLGPSLLIIVLSIPMSSFILSHPIFSGFIKQLAEKIWRLTQCKIMLYLYIGQWFTEKNYV